MNTNFQLILFSANPRFAQKAIFSGVDAILVDWESLGKRERQVGADTEINAHTPQELALIRKAVSSPIICRLNNHPQKTVQEIEQAIFSGANELLLPMVRSVSEVERCLQQVAGRARVGILIETLDAIRVAPELAALPLSRVFIGLNDLAIECSSKNIFSPIVDGTIEKLRSSFNIPFGFGGLTLPECGHPIPCELLAKEMVRLGCHFSFLRRSFHRDMKRRKLSFEIPRMKKWMQQLRNRSRLEIESDSQTLKELICSL